MNSERTTFQSLTARLWRSDKPLTAAGLLMLAALAAFAVGLFVDPRTIAGAPAWLKPAKFAASTAIYALTLAWVFTMLPSWRRTRLLVGWTTAVVVRDGSGHRRRPGLARHDEPLQRVDACRRDALRGDGPRHRCFRRSRRCFVASALFREPFAQRAMGTALRAGMVITIVGASSAGLMTRPTERPGR